MEITLLRVMGVSFFGFAGYIMLSLAIPRLRDNRWRHQPVSVFLLGTAFCILLGLWGFGIGRPYTRVSAIVVWGIAFLVQRRVPGEGWFACRQIMGRREAILVLVIVAGMIAVMLRVLLR